jgi:lipoprotein-releasing system permease protein
MSRAMGLVTDIAIKHVTSRLRQTLVAMLGVATGVGFSIMMAALMQGSQDDFVKTLVNALPHVTITDELRVVARQPAAERYDVASIRGLKPRDDRHGIKSPAAILAVIDSIPGITAAPYVSTRGIIRSAGQDRGVSVLGIDWRRDAEVSQLASQMRQGSLSDLTTAANAIIIGSRLSEKLGATVGTRVNLVAAGAGTLQAQVVGIFHAGVTGLDEGQVYTLIRTAQVLLGKTGFINEIRLRTADPLQARAIAQEIEARLPYRAISWQEAQEDLLSAFQIRNLIMYTVVSAILLVASMGTYNIISTITHQKARDIAIMKSLGLPSQLVRRIFVLESLIVGLAGAVIGWGIGYVLCLGLGLIEIKSPFMDSTRLPIAYSPLHYVIATAVAVVSSVIAGYLPARKAARVNPVEIIRGAT